MTNKIGGRKFALCLLALVMAFILALANKLTAEFASVAATAVAAYAGANAYITGKTKDAPVDSQ